MKSKNKLLILVLSISLLVVLLVLLLSRPKEAITIGFTGGITGPLSELGVSARNAFVLRVEEINQAGGINGHPVNTLILDDENDPIILHRNFNTFKENDVHYVVGPLISGMAEATIKEANDDILIMSPSISSDVVSDLDDNFYRVSTSIKEQPKYLINYLESLNESPSFSIVYDVRNATYVNEFMDYFTNNYSGEVLKLYPIGEHEPIKYDPILTDLTSNKADALLFLTPATITAEFSQLLQLESLTFDRYSVSWSMTADLIASGGQSVEGIKFIYMAYDDINDSPHKDPTYSKNYANKYNSDPDFISGLSYQATDLIIQAISQGNPEDIETVSEAFKAKSYETLGETITFNSTGDRVQEFALYILENQEYIKYID